MQDYCFIGTFFLFLIIYYVYTALKIEQWIYKKIWTCIKMIPNISSSNYISKCILGHVCIIYKFKKLYDVHYMDNYIAITQDNKKNKYRFNM